MEGSQMNSHYETRPLDPKQDWEFYHVETNLVTEDLARLSPLTKASSELLWREYISKDEADFHPSPLTQNHWIHETGIKGPDWMPSWDKPTDNSVALFLRTQIPWDEDEIVYFVWHREDSVRTFWSVFVRNWRPFLFEDECPFLFSPAQSEAVVFYPSGTLKIVHRRT